MKNILLTLITATAFFLNNFVAHSQAKKPQLMVIPADNWMNQNGYVQAINNQGKTSYEMDYRKALLNDANMKLCIAKLSDNLVQRHYPPKILDEELKRLESADAEDAVVTSKNGEDISNSQLLKVLQQAKSDIIIRLNYEIKRSGPEKYIIFYLEGIDAYTSESIGASTLIGTPAPVSDDIQLINEAANAKIDDFMNKLDGHFQDILTNGRKISMNVSVFQGWEQDLESEDFGDDELGTLIDSWVADNTVANRYNLNFSDDRKMVFESVRIPLYYTDSKGEQRAMDSKRWAKGLQDYLKSLNITSKVIMKGLGSVQVILGSK